MSHYEVRFQGTTAEKERQALKECEKFIGKANVKKVCEAIYAQWMTSKHKSKTYRNIAAQLEMFVGISGRWPVRALIKKAVVMYESASRL